MAHRLCLRRLRLRRRTRWLPDRKPFGQPQREFVRDAFNREVASRLVPIRDPVQRTGDHESAQFGDCTA